MNITLDEEDRMLVVEALSHLWGTTNEYLNETPGISVEKEKQLRSKLRNITILKEALS